MKISEKSFDETIFEKVTNKTEISDISLNELLKNYNKFSTDEVA